MAFQINGYNIGTDASVSIQHVESGIVLPVALLGHLMELQFDQEDTVIRVVPISNGGKPLYNVVYLGWRGHLMLTRLNGALTAIMSALEKDYFDNGHLNHFNMLVTVLNRDGSTDQYLFTAGVMSRHQGGNFRADKEVDQRVEVQFQRMILTAGIAALFPIIGG